MTALWFLPPVGTPKNQLPTPALLIDLPVMEANLVTMATFFRDRPAKLRPHFKTHKSAVLARFQMEVGAIGITCAKLGEAEILVEARIPSVLIANEVVDPVKISRLAEMAQQAQLIVAVDQADNLRQLSMASQAVDSTIHVLVEVNIGLNRCGVAPGEPALRLASLASKLPGINFLGVMGYEGHAVLEPDLDQRRAKVQNALGELIKTVHLVRQAGFPVEIVSAGGTGTYDMTGAYPGITEVQTGSYIFMDTTYRRPDLPFRNALSVLATVMSSPGVGRCVIDAGLKAFSTDMGLPGVVSPPGAHLIRLHEEHSILEYDPTKRKLRIGDRVEMLPSHICTTVNLHDRYYALRDGRLEAVWEISGRGKTQ